MDQRQTNSATPESAARQMASGLPLWKRLLDVTLILVTSPLWLPVMLLIGVLIKLASRGPALFRQQRVGYLGRPFTCFKFRTMVVNADANLHRGHLNQLMESNAPMTKLDAGGDPRVIPGGRILRALGLDELPQLFNILRGDMSLVGPRPCVPYEYARYSARHRERLHAVPGLTGLWQVSGKNRTTFEQMIDLDIYYARNKSLGLDLKIILRTLPAVLSQARDLHHKRRAARRHPAPVLRDVPLEQR